MRDSMTKLTAQAAGTFAIAPTPFQDDGRIDEKSIDRLTDFYAEVGCDGVTVLGILGEAPKLDAAEAEQVAVRFVKRAKSMQIIVGVSAPGFASMRSLAKASMDAGGLSADAQCHLHARRDPQDRDGLAILRHAQARGLAGPREDYDAARLS